MWPSDKSNLLEEGIAAGLWTKLTSRSSVLVTGESFLHSSGDTISDSTPHILQPWKQRPRQWKVICQAPPQQLKVGYMVTWSETRYIHHAYTTLTVHPYLPMLCSLLRDVSRSLLSATAKPPHCLKPAHGQKIPNTQVASVGPVLEL